jgi:hypothetical protein
LFLLLLFLDFLRLPPICGEGGGGDEDSGTGTTLEKPFVLELTRGGEAGGGGGRTTGCATAATAAAPAFFCLASQLPIL